jgi:hypothetical protein
LDKVALIKTLKASENRGMFSTSAVFLFSKPHSGYNHHKMMMAVALNPQEYYAAQGQISHPGSYASHLDSLPGSLPELVEAIQGLILHVYWAERYGITLNRIRKEETNLRLIKDRLAKLLEMSAEPLAQTRQLTQKTVGTCRDFALMLTAILRHQNVPARARAGFGTYFTKGRYEDHWICEYWRADEVRWVTVDPQLDALQIETLSIDFNPLDLPPGAFITGAKAWQLCRSKAADPNLFGIFNLKGLDFVKGNLIRDFLALNKIEILPWDNFMLIEKKFLKMNPGEKALMDRLATISSGDDRDFLLARAAFTANKDQLLPSYFL